MTWYRTQNTMTRYRTQSHYPDTKPTSSCPFLIMPSAWLGSDKYQLHWFASTRVRVHEVRNPQSPKTGEGSSIHSATHTPSGSNYIKQDMCIQSFSIAVNKNKNKRLKFQISLSLSQIKLNRVPLNKCDLYFRFR